MNGTIYLTENANLDRSVGTAEQLMSVAQQGVLPKYALMSLLDVEYRQAFLDACAVIEKKYTEDCTAANDPCLESGCALEGAICLDPLMRAGIEYQKACAAEWAKLFADPRKRVEVWKH
jgi:hypothetical protein